MTDFLDVEADDVDDDDVDYITSFERTRARFFMTYELEFSGLAGFRISSFFCENICT